jgi:translation initiation factor IF-3
MVGVVDRFEALRRAAEANLDLVEVASQSHPPVCKILDYGKYKYEQQKKKQEAKKNQKTIEVKEVQFRPMIDENDFQVKCRNVERFLAAGNKVKVVLRYRGRELAHKEFGEAVLNRVKETFEEVAKVENRPKLEGRQIIMILAPLA